jgi:hypothetical protein
MNTDLQNRFGGRIRLTRLARRVMHQSPIANRLYGSNVGQLRGAEAGPPTGPGGRPPGLFVTHAHRAGGRPFRFSGRAGRAGVVLRYMPGRAGGRSIFRSGARGRRPVF